MSDRLPPLTALRAFDAAARHMSFARAAQELNVTPAALSYQIKSLETHLGTPLFVRLNRAVELTDAGRALAPGVAQGFADLARAWGQARRVSDGAGLTVAAGPAFTAAFLVPRLHSFAQSHPDIDLRISASLGIQDLEREGIDIAIRFTPGWRDQGIPLMQEIWTPMAAPHLSARIVRPADLLTLPLLQQVDSFVSPTVDWAAYLSALDLPLPDRLGVGFNQPQHALGAAVAGSGVALGRLSLAEQELRSGALTMPLAESLRRDTGFCAILRRSNCARSTQVLEWLRSEMAALLSLAQGRRFLE